jgi:hypothetical protein
MIADQSVDNILSQSLDFNILGIINLRGMGILPVNRLEACSTIGLIKPEEADSPALRANQLLQVLYLIAPSYLNKRSHLL